MSQSGSENDEPQSGSPENDERDERDAEIARLRAENERLRASPPPAPPAPSSSPYRTDPRIFDGRTHDASAPPPPMYAAPNLTGYYVAPPDPNHYRAPNYGAAPQHAHYYAAPGYGWTQADHLNPDAPRYPNWPHPPPVLRPLAPEGNVPESASSYRADPRMYDGMTHDASAPPPPMHAYYAQSPQYYGQPPTVLRPLAPPGAPSERRRNRNPRRDVPVPENVETVPMCFKCGWRNCRRVHPRRCTGAGGPCTICGTTSHATKYHIEFERYIAARKPRPPTEPEGEDIEAMMRGVGLSDPPQPEGDIPLPGPASSGGPPGYL